MLKEKELRQLVSLLKKIEDPHKGLPQPIFDALIKVVPFVACELAITDKKGRLLLTWRDDKWWQGWHFPGGLFRFRESFRERLEEVARRELGVGIKKYDFLFVKDCSQGRRGHVVDLVFRCETTKTPKHGKFFNKMPKNIIEDHKEFWKRIKKFK
ncbi:NUDIX domain-containing protein [Patescibacteria group bacterium]|nr:NUDIX domain-containing protein [Patescibacteria group bacterium]